MKKLLWIDLEMTGLDVEKEAIIEVACLVTNLQLETLDHYQSVVHQPQELLDQMDEWNSKNHRISGLYDEIKNGKPLEKVEEELIEIIKKHFKNDRAVLAGNSIFQDKLFINKYLKSLSPLLHYRVVDVTSWKIICNELKLFYPKKNTHRALDDIKESLEELKYYTNTLKQNIIPNNLTKND